MAGVAGGRQGASQDASWVHIAALFVALEFIYTGLFITTHGEELVVAL